MRVVIRLIFGCVLTRALQRCKQPNYMTENRKIYAVDPDDASNKKEIRIRGVNWSGMENTDTSILMGLWGREPSKDPYAINGTSISRVGKFLSSHNFNSIRFPLSAKALLHRGPVPQTDLIHNYLNPELVNATTQLDFLMKVTKALTSHSISVLLDIHTLVDEPKDPLWYRGEFTSIDQTDLYKALALLADNMCGDEYWNVLGVDLKNEPFEARWDAASTETTIDWRLAAEQLGKMVIEKCPKWLVFVEGVGSPTRTDFHKVSDRYDALYADWHGANLRNAMANPIHLPNKLVLSPHTYAQGVYPQNYFYTLNSTCVFNPSADGKHVCMDYLNGKLLSRPYHECKPSKFICEGYQHLESPLLQDNTRETMKGMFGFLTDQPEAPPIVLGEFGGVYGVHQPHQTAVTDEIVRYIGSHLNGGYFWALNPESEYYLEGAVNGQSGSFPRTHYGLLQLNDWEKAHEDLLKTLKTIPSTKIPCFGDKNKLTGGGNENPRNSSPVRFNVLAAAFITVLGIYNSNR